MSMGSSTNGLREELRAFVRETFLFDGDAELDDGQSLLASGILDSTGVLELVAYLEDTYDLRIRDEEIVPENLDSIDCLNAFVGARLGH
jgi:acyl carrier protein